MPDRVTINPALLPANLPYWITGFGPDARFGTGLGTPETIDYGYAQTGTNPSGQAYRTLTTGEIANIEASIDKLVANTGLSFNFVTSGADLLIGASSDPNETAYGRSYGTQIVAYDHPYATSSGLAGNAYIYVHELMHAVGLGHSTSVFGNTAPDAIPDADSYGTTLFGRWSSYWQSSTQLFDVAALQFLYGPDPTQRTGNDVYTPLLAAFDPANPDADNPLLWDGGGFDTIDLSSATGPANASLAAGVISQVDTTNTGILDSGTFAINYNSIFEKLIGTSFGDTLSGSTSGDSIEGGAGGDTLMGNGGADTLLGGGGDDTLDGGFGPDRMIGGYGNDTYILGSATDVIIEHQHQGRDHLVSALLDTNLGSVSKHIEDLTLTRSSDQNGTGNARDNLITGHLHDNALSGRLGSDTLMGMGGEDTLNGGGGADLMIGGYGSDVYIVNDQLDRVIEKAYQGTDLVKSSVSLTLAAHVENLELTGSQNLNGTGNARNNEITGNAGRNILNGDAGNDTLEGGAGNDTFVFEGNFGRDVILDFSASNAEKIDLSGVSSIVSFYDLINNHLWSSNGASAIITPDSRIFLEGISKDEINYGQAYSQDDFIF